MFGEMPHNNNELETPAPMTGVGPLAKPGRKSWRPLIQASSGSDRRRKRRGPNSCQGAARSLH